MAWKNIKTPQRFEPMIQQALRLEQQEFELKQLNRLIDQYEKEFANIFEAAKEFGEIYITHYNDTIKLKVD